MRFVIGRQQRLQSIDKITYKISAVIDGDIGSNIILSAKYGALAVIIVPFDNLVEISVHFKIWIDVMANCQCLRLVSATIRGMDQISV